jgi:magnesium-transporting ATPase (P-type)
MNNEKDVFHYAQIANNEALWDVQSDVLAGLSDNEATKRLKELGLNVLQGNKQTNLVLDVLQHFKVFPIIWMQRHIAKLKKVKIKLWNINKCFKNTLARCTRKSYKMRQVNVRYAE